MLEEVVVHCWEFRWIRWMKQNVVAQFFQLLKHRLCYVHSSIILEKNWALSVDQCQWQTLQVLVHLIDLLSILLRCNGFARIQKALEDRTGSRPPVTVTFFWWKSGFGKFFGPSSWLNHWVSHCRLSYKIQENPYKINENRMSQSDCEMVHCCYVE